MFFNSNGHCDVSSCDNFSDAFNWTVPLACNSPKSSTGSSLIFFSFFFFSLRISGIEKENNVLNFTHVENCWLFSFEISKTRFIQLKTLFQCSSQKNDALVSLMPFLIFKVRFLVLLIGCFKKCIFSRFFKKTQRLISKSERKRSNQLKQQFFSLKYSKRSAIIWWLKNACVAYIDVNHEVANWYTSKFPAN